MQNELAGPKDRAMKHTYEEVAPPGFPVGTTHGVLFRVRFDIDQQAEGIDPKHVSKLGACICVRHSLAPPIVS